MYSNKKKQFNVFQNLKLKINSRENFDFIIFKGQ